MVTKTAAAKAAGGDAVPASEAILSKEQADALRYATARDLALAAAIAGVVDRWVADRLHNSPASRDVEVINHIKSTLPNLVADIVAAIKKEI